ncbi:peptide ABC transporter permease [Paenibacillus swuensis]|uniref:Peptide ABC transporter permease n=1 Tax=Paenibacillus swuensis TaxID=1178515 RepID=A0A172TJX4_9BACL|nr:ABC transporter permease [Paenibacillus swuensis]ANE47355.1 peptide ABC transporter permease [Paenibacillus swuensis]
MARYLSSKLIYMLISLFILASATFFLMKIIPGDPFQSEKAIPPEIKKSIMAYYGLDKPLGEQYVNYMKNLVTGDLGMSMKMQHTSVVKIIKGSFGYSAQLGIIAIITSVIVGLFLGLVAALHHRKLLDNLAMIVAVIGVSVPNFVLASIMQFVLGEKLGWFKVAGLNGPLDYVMPVIALSALPVAFIARLTRSSMLEVLSSDYIKTAKAKGLAKNVVLIKHALRNGIMPVVTYVGPLTANIITGSVVVEKIFGIPGLGKFFVQSVGNRDYTLIMGITLFYAVILMSARFLTDVAYGFVDPRIKLSNRKGGA